MHKNILTVLSLLVIAVASAQQTETTSAVSTAGPSNALLYLIMGACAILLLAVAILGKIFLRLTAMAIDKRMGKTITILLLLLATNTLFAQSNPGQKTFELPVSGEILLGTVVLLAELLVVLWMLLKINGLLNEVSGKPKKVSTFELHLPRLFENINASVAIEKEKDILLDHDYDGIRELDNSLPPWWKYSFYISIVWSVFYLGYYYVGGGPTGVEEYKAEVLQAQIEVEAFTKKNALNVDENNVQLADAAGILDGLDIFKTNCAACHGATLEGGVGPNLTDDYWLHGGNLNEVFKSVKYGWPAKGMKSWQSDLSAVQIKNVISYIHSLHGSNPANAKAAQGDLYIEPGTAKPDSLITAAVDTLKK